MGKAERVSAHERGYVFFLHNVSVSKQFGILVLTASLFLAFTTCMLLIAEKRSLLSNCVQQLYISSNVVNIEFYNLSGGVACLEENNGGKISNLLTISPTQTNV